MNILVVDDSKIIRIMLIRILNELGYDQIVEAVDTDSALLRMEIKKPDLILSDFNMPGKSGLEFLRIVRRNPETAKIPFVLITTVHDKKIIVQAVQSGLQYFILKPVEKNVLAEKLTALAETYNFQLPLHLGKGATGTAPANTPASAENTGSNKKLPLELLDAVLDHFFLVFDGEMSLSDFLSWAKEHIIGALPENDKIRNEQQLLDLMRSAAHQGIFSALKKYTAEPSL
ncbi:MAG: response regulator [Chitinispirillaceae bacterium]|nr:response regulator [Chitinispirillaceae bacterium]